MCCSCKKKHLQKATVCCIINLQRGVIMNRLRQVREKNEMLQRDVANFLGISTSAYGFYETGARSMSAETAKRLAKFFNVSVDYLLGVIIVLAYFKVLCSALFRFLLQLSFLLHKIFMR